jgi:hypothetical protein
LFCKLFWKESITISNKWWYVKKGFFVFLNPNLYYSMTYIIFIKIKQYPFIKKKIFFFFVSFKPNLYYPRIFTAFFQIIKKCWCWDCWERKHFVTVRSSISTNLK